MIFQMIVCICCLAGCAIMLIANLIVYWKINKLLKTYAEIEEEKPE